MAKVSKQDRLRLSDPWLTTGHRYDHTHYHSSNQALIYIGPYLLDEVVSIQYRFSQSKVPIYSYASQYYDAMASGRCIGNGQMTINYIDQGYLFLAMLNAHKLLRPQASVTQDYYKALSIYSQQSQQANQIGRLLGEFHHTYFKNLADGRALNTRQLRKISDTLVRYPGVKNELVKVLKEKFWGPDGQSQRTKQGLDRNVTNTHLDQFFKDEVNLDHVVNARPDQMPPINVVVSHGNPLDKRYNTYKILRDVEFLGQEMGMVPTGQAQTESHSFVFKTIS